MIPKTAIIIPAYNEEKRIGRTLEEYGRFFKEKKKNKEIENYELVVILNACKDGTIDIVKKCEKKFKGIKHLEFERSGKGFAIIEGFKEALKKNSQIIGFVDADMATSPKDFYDLLINLKDYDGVIASRRVKGAIVDPLKSLRRLMASSIFNFLIRSLFFMPYRDTQCGAKIFKRRAIEKALPQIGITKWAFDVDLLYKLKKEKMKVREFPTHWSDKEYSKINLMGAGPSMFLAVIRLRILNSPFKGFIRIYNKISEGLFNQK